MPKRKYYRKIYQKTKAKRIAFFVLKMAGLFLFLAIAGSIFLFLYFTKDLPRPEKFSERSFVQSTKIYDRTGEVLLYELYNEEKREIIPLSLVPDHLKEAVISVEDANFYSHPGIDIKAIFRSIMADLKLKKPAFGASTISQQLIRSTFLTTKKTIERKVREIILTMELERRYTKDQILEWYLNQVPFGPNLYGVQAASKTFFGKEAKDLTISESAVLAAAVQAPSYFSPYGQHKDELLARKDYVLNRMAQEHYITEEEAEILKKEEIVFMESTQPIKAPHFVFYVQDYLFEKYGKDFLEKEGLKIYTSLDWDLQQAAEKAVAEGAKNNRASRAYNAA
ncbi:MAG: transglycosylase domain-containing protein, partial [Patescibacteria group bacterium]